MYWLILLLLSTSIKQLHSLLHPFNQLQIKSKTLNQLSNKYKFRLCESFIDSIRIQKWGVFNNATIDFTGKPCFIAITGETGSGKSIFISALEYIAGLISNNYIRKFNTMNSYNDMILDNNGNQEDSQVILKLTNNLFQ